MKFWDPEQGDHSTLYAMIRHVSESFFDNAIMLLDRSKSLKEKGGLYTIWSIKKSLRSSTGSPTPKFLDRREADMPHQVVFFFEMHAYFLESPQIFDLRQYMDDGAVISEIYVCEKAADSGCQWNRTCVLQFPVLRSLKNCDTLKPQVFYVLTSIIVSIRSIASHWTNGNYAKAILFICYVPDRASWCDSYTDVRISLPWRNSKRFAVSHCYVHVPTTYRWVGSGWEQSSHKIKPENNHRLACCPSNSSLCCWVELYIDIILQ